MNKLNHISLVIFLFFGVLSPFQILASNDEPDNMTILKGETPNGRPQAPSRQLALAYYENGTLYFSFAIPEGSATVTIEGSQTFIYDDIDTSVVDGIYIGDITENLYILVETSNGHYYDGTLIIQ